MITAMTTNAGKSSERRLRKIVIRIIPPKRGVFTLFYRKMLYRLSQALESRLVDHDDAVHETGIIMIQAHHPFTPPMVRPDWKYLRANKNNSIKGIEMITAVAAK